MSNEDNFPIRFINNDPHPENPNWIWSSQKQSMFWYTLGNLMGIMSEETRVLLKAKDIPIEALYKAAKACAECAYMENHP